ITPSVIPAVRSRYSTPLLNAMGPALNHVSSLNSSTGEKALLATSGALCAVTPNRTTNSTIPPNQTPKTDQISFRLVLIPCFSAGDVPPTPGAIGGAPATALIAPPIPPDRGPGARRRQPSRPRRSKALPRGRRVGRR